MRSKREKLPGEAMRRYNLKMYPTKEQERRLDEVRRLHCNLYNAVVEQREHYWKRGSSISLGDQKKQLKDLRAALPEMAGVSSQSMQATVERVDAAYQLFFSNIKRGQFDRAGKPTFKSSRRYPGWKYLSAVRHMEGKSGEIAKGNGWSWEWTTGTHRAWFRMSDIGGMRCKGKTDLPWGGQVRDVTVVKKASGWYASISVSCFPLRRHGTEDIAIAWGVERLWTLDNGEYKENPRVFDGYAKKLARAQRDLGRKTKGSARYEKQIERIAKIHEKIARVRRNMIHQESAYLVKRAGKITMMSYDVAEMVESARGTVEKPGTGVRQKSNLNRRILDTSPGMFIDMIRYKMTEAGGELDIKDPKKHRPAHRCPSCMATGYVPLEVRQFHCLNCGATMHRSHLVARNLKLPPVEPETAVEATRKKKRS